MAQTKAQLVVGLNVNASAPASALQIDASGNVNLDSNTLYVDATNNRVGVGTATPTATLDCNGSIRAISASPVIPSSGAGLEIYYASGTFNGTPSAYLLSYDRTGTVYKPINIDASEQVFRTSGSEKMRLTSTGLGIGTSSPGGNLTVTDASTYTLNVNANAGGAGALLSTVGGSASLALGTNSTERVRITAAGNVGIGTTSPNANSQLHIAGSSYQPLYVNTTASDGGGAAFLRSGTQALYVGTAGGNWLTGSSTADGLIRSEANLIFATGGNTQRAQIDSSGRLLVGTSSAPSSSVQSHYGKLIVSGNSANNNHAYAAFITGYTAATQGPEVSRFVFGNTDAEYARIDVALDGTAASGSAPGRMVFYTTASGASSPTERMRINSAGFFKATGTGSYQSATDTYHEFVSASNGKEILTIIHNGTTGNQYGLSILTANNQDDATRWFLYCQGGGVQKAVIRSNGGLANFSANNVNLSDINTKKDISPAAGTWDCIKEWEIVNYRYKEQPDDADLNLGVIAQQVAESCPEVITVFEEAKDDQPEKLGIKEQQMYWMAIKALQEAQVRIEQLEAKVAALESA